MKIAIYGIKFDDDAIPSVKQLMDVLSTESVDYTIYQPFRQYLTERMELPADVATFNGYEDLKGNADVLFSLGGDGTMLETIILVRDSGIPILGINTGRLGFLSSIAKEEVEQSVKEVLNGNFYMAKRSLLRFDSSSNLFGDLNFALNELTIHKKDTSSMISIHTWVDGDFLNTFWADGLIIATPTGSTGYSMSCGGPIIHPATKTFMITAIAPHNLNIRPFIIPDSAEIILKVEGRSDSFLATLDSRSVTIDSSVEMTVRKAKFDIEVVRLNNQSFLTTLKNKFMWGMDKRN